jgi:NAD(P)-dependent dehydrogenase (short-subunit alcohol dehydrogenase family)
MSFIGYSAYSGSKYALKGLCDALRSEFAAVGCRFHFYAPANMDTPGFANENLTKPAITASIEGQASTVTAEEAARALIAGVLHERYVISNDLLGELIRVVVNGANPRPNSITEILSIPLLSFIFAVWTFVTDLQISNFYRKQKE